MGMKLENPVNSIFILVLFTYFDKKDEKRFLKNPFVGLQLYK